MYEASDDGECSTEPRTVRVVGTIDQPNRPGNDRVSSRERKANRSRLLGVGDEREPGGEQKAEELTVVVSKSDTPQETEDLFFKKKRVPSSRYAASLGCPRNAADARVLSLSPRSSTHSLSLSLSAHQDAQRRE